MNVLQVGAGNFGRRHLAAWQRLGLGERLWVAEADRTKWDEAVRLGVSPRRLVASMGEALEAVDAVDVVTPTQSHAALCREALEAGKDVFVEKPMTLTTREAREVAECADRTRRIVQVGYSFRFHPVARRLKADVEAGRFGRIRYVSGAFSGFKRARTDVGVTHTDGIHFLDLFNWLLGTLPVDAYAVCRDHFGRGLEDFSVVLLTYPGGAVGKVESGYIQPGRWPDPVVAGAMTTKEITVVGERATAEADFEAGTLAITEAAHEPRGGTWAPVLGPRTPIEVETCDPAQLICRELTAFIESVQGRTPTPAGPVECGVHLAVLMERIYESARLGRPMRVEAGVPAAAMRP